MNSTIQVEVNVISGRKIVTAVVALVSFLVILGQLGCTGQMRSLREGETRLAEMQRTKAELAGTYLIDLDATAVIHKDTAPVADRRARDLLNRFVALSDAVLRLDDQKGIAVTGRDRIEAERDRAKTLLAGPAV